MEDAVAAASTEREEGRCDPSPAPPAELPPPAAPLSTPSPFQERFGRMFAYARNETMQIIRDPIRLAFAFIGSALLMFVFGFGITTDVEHIRYASLDLDQSPESRGYLEQFVGSPRYFAATAPAPIGRRRPPASAVGRYFGRLRDSAQLRQGLPQWLGSRGPGAGGWRDDVPGRHHLPVRAGRSRSDTEGPPALGLQSPEPTRVQSEYRRKVHVQTRRSRACTRSFRAYRAPSPPDTGDSHDRQHRAREGARLESSTSTSRRPGSSSTSWENSCPMWRSAC